MKEEESETYVCGLRFNAEPPKPAEFVEYDAGSFGNIKMHKFPELDRKTPLQEFLGERTQLRDYVLTEEEHKRFDAVEGCTSEEIEMAKKVLSKTLSTSNKMRWRKVGDSQNRFTGINSNPFATQDIQSRIEYLDDLKKNIVNALQVGAITLGQAVQLLDTE